MSLSRNAFYNSAAGLIRIGLTIITMPLLIRLLGVKNYGLWTLVSAFTEIVVFAGNGISITSSVFLSKHANQEETNQELSQTLTILSCSVLLVATLAALMVILFAEYIVSAFPYLDIEQANIMLISLNFGALIIWSRLIQQVSIGIEQAFQKYGELNLLNTIQYLLLNLGFLGIVKYGGSILQLMQWQSFVYLILLFGHYWLVKRTISNCNSNYKFSLSWNHEKFLDIMRHSFIMLSLCLGGVVFNKGDRIIVAYYLSPTLLGIYSGITEVASAIIIFSSLPVQPIVPLLSSHSFSKGNNEYLKDQIKQILEISSSISIICGSWLFVLSPLVTKFLFSEESNIVILNLFKIAIIIYTFISIYSVGFHTLLSLSVGTAAIVYLISAVLSLSLIAYGSATLGLSGAVIGNIGFVFCWSMLFVAMKKLFLPSLFWLKCITVPLLLFVITITIIFALDLNLLSSIVINSCSTILMTIWFGFVQKERVMKIISKFRTA
jgi:O-antigen/teichoic acid export membrane protein